MVTTKMVRWISVITGPLSIASIYIFVPSTFKPERTVKSGLVAPRDCIDQLRLRSAHILFSLRHLP